VRLLVTQLKKGGRGGPHLFGRTADAVERLPFLPWPAHPRPTHSLTNPTVSFIIETCRGLICISSTIFVSSAATERSYSSSLRMGVPVENSDPTDSGLSNMQRGDLPPCRCMYRVRCNLYSFRAVRRIHDTGQCVETAALLRRCPAPRQSDTIRGFSASR
jgi:hypothetical protein